MLYTHLDLEKGEEIFFEVRKHWYVFFWYVVVFILLVVLPLIIYFAALALMPIYIRDQILDYFFLELFLYLIWFLFAWLALFLNWTNYYLDVWYITEKRIIDIEQKGIFHREVSNLRFDKIQDITVEVRGVVATFLKFGDLRLQTASENSKDFTMKNASRPEEARKIIFEVHNKVIQTKKSQSEMNNSEDV